MGCDIHLFVEKENENNSWEVVKGKNPWIEEYQSWADNATDEKRKNYLLERVEEMKKNETMVTEGWLYDGRNYNLFSILADVRNDYNIKPIDYPRGIPEDVSDKVREENNKWDCGGHSHSWFTFKELMDYDWDNNFVENEGFVSEETYKQFKETGDPYPCSKGIGGGNVEKVLNCEMERIIKNKYSWEKNKSFYTTIKWTESFKDIADGLLHNIEKFIKENNIEQLENYRIVFWFDN